MTAPSAIRARPTGRLLDLVPLFLAALAETAWVAAAAGAWLARKRRLAFARLPVAIQRQVLHRQLTELGIDRIDFERIELLRSAAGTRVVIRPGHALARRADGLLECHRIGTAGFGRKRRQIEIRGGRGGCVFDGVTVAWQVEARPGVRRPAFPLV